MDLKLKNNNNIVIPLYNQVEYIESIGTPNINTGINVTMYWTDGYIIECVIEVLENVSGNSPQIYFNDNSNDGYLGMKCSGDSDNTFLVYGRTSKESVSYATIKFNGKVTIQQKGYYSSDSNNYITVNGVQTTLHPGNVARTLGNIRILNSGEVRTRIYSFKIRKYSGSGDVYNTVRDYIPVISLQSDHIGEACLYDRVSNSYYYSAPTGSFTAPTQGLYDIINTIYIKDCPSISGIDVLRKSYNLERVRCDLGNVTGHLSEIYKYSNLSGFNDNYENQTKPRLIGTFNIDDYYTNSEIYSISEKLDGTTINTLNPTQYNVDTLLENDDLAIQTLDSTKPNYNPAVAIILNNNNLGHLTINPINQGEGKYFLKKSEAAAITGLSTYFLNKSTVTDTNNIVSPDSGTTQTYDFSNFDEFNLFTGLTTIPGGAAAGVSGFSGCSKLTALDIPSNITSMATYSMPNCSALQSISIPKECTSIGSGAFANDSALTSVYYDGTVENWMNITFGNEYANPLTYAHNLYINNELLTSLSIPSTLTSIKANVFSGARCLSGNLVIPNTVTSIGASAFSGCSGITGNIIIPSSVKSIGSNAFNGCSGLTGKLTIPNSVTSIGNNAFQNCNKITSINIPNTVSYGGSCFSGCTNLKYLKIKPSTTRWSATLSNCKLASCDVHVLNNYSTQSRWDSTFNNMYIYGDMQTGMGTYLTILTSLRVKGIGHFGGMGQWYSQGGTKFFEIMGNMPSGNYYVYAGTLIFHSGYNGKVPATPGNVGMSHISKFYVGDGSSRSHDEDILALYLANSDWSGQSAKLATWYDYNGTYKWYRVTDNLTNCTNTNPDEWPHITRGDSYQTTIVANEGMTIDSVTVEMYEAVDNGTTPNTPTDITNDVYNASTGEINIPSVTGNIIITAMAS